jgi:hypothetical protein
VRKVQTAALRRKLLTAMPDSEAPPARRALDALATADEVIDRASTGATTWRDAAAQVMVARAAVASALRTLETAREARSRASRKAPGPARTTRGD